MNSQNDNLEPAKLAEEDHIRALLPSHMWTYREGQLQVTIMGVACLCISILNDKLPGDKTNAQKLLDQTGYANPFVK